MPLRQIAALISLLEQRGLYDAFVEGGGRLAGNAEADTVQSLIDLITRYQDYDLFLSVIRNPEWMNEMFETASDTVSASLMDIIVSEYIDIYENMTAGKVLEASSVPHFRRVRFWLEEETT